MNNYNTQNRVWCWIRGALCILSSSEQAKVCNWICIAKQSCQYLHSNRTVLKVQTNTIIIKLTIQLGSFILDFECIYWPNVRDRDNCRLASAINLSMWPWHLSHNDTGTSTILTTWQKAISGLWRNKVKMFPFWRCSVGKETNGNEKIIFIQLITLQIHK